MKTDFKKYGIMIIAAVLLVGVVFSGAASAVSITADEWNSLTTSEQINGNSSYEFTGSGIIYPKFNGSADSYFDPNRSITFDFKDFTGTFAGDFDNNTGYRGALFGYIQNASFAGTIAIQNLTLSNVVVNAFGGSYLGGVIGGYNANALSLLTFTDCKLINCAIGNTSSGERVGGLIGSSWNVTFVDCEAIHCDIVSGTKIAGGLIGAATPARFLRCNVTSCTIEVNDCLAGGLAGGTDVASYLTCCVEDTLVYAVNDCVGGLVGWVDCPISDVYMAGCDVKNCVIASDCSFGIGGLVGYASSALNGIRDCQIVNCTMTGDFSIGGLVGMEESVPTGWSGNFVINCAINGTTDTTNLVCGDKPGLENPDNCTVTGVNYIRNQSAEIPQPSISILKGSDTPSSELKTAIIVTKLSNIGIQNNPQYACGYVIESSPVEFNPGVGSAETYSGTVKVGAQTINPLYLAGYVFNGWNLSSADGTMLSDAAGVLQNNVPGYTNATGYWNNVSGTTVVLFANLTLNKTEVTATDNKAEFGNDNVTAIRSQDTVSQVLLEDVSSVTNTTVTFIADNTSVAIPSVAGYDEEEIAVFEINATAIGTATFKVTVTFADRETATAKKGNVRFFHYVDSDWEQLTIYTTVQNNANVTYTVETTSFSPFGFGIYTEIPTPTPKKHSESKDMGSTVILTETVTPTPVPTATPTATAVPTIATVKPTSQQTSQSPAPVFGLIAGLGAAAVLLRLRK